MSEHKPSNRLDQRFAELQSSQRKALAAFITAGDPDLAATVPALHALVEAGADILEVGVPFSDPEAEGPAIQVASERALKNGTTMRSVLSMIEKFRRTDSHTPIVLMGYLNSILAMGESAFAQAAAAAGVDGLIMVNLPPEEAESIVAVLAEAGISLILLVAPTTTAARRKYIVSQCSGFVYYVSLKGTTGAALLVPAEVQQNVGELQALTDLPVLVGFGVKDAATAQAAGQAADGVVVGTALVRIMGDSALSVEERHATLRSLILDLRSGLDA